MNIINLYRGYLLRNVLGCVNKVPADILKEIDEFIKTEKGREGLCAFEIKFRLGNIKNKPYKRINSTLHKYFDNLDQISEQGTG